MTGLGPGTLFYAGFFLLVLVGIALYASRRASRKRFTDPREEHELGGRSLPFLVLLGTLYASQYSGNSFIGFTGKAARDGYAFVASMIIMQGIIVFYLLYAPRLFQLSRTQSYRTPGDFLLDRFGNRPLHALGSLIMLFGLLNFILTQLVAVGKITLVLGHGDIHPAWGIFILAVIMAAYENVGGMRAVAYTDMLQGLLLLFGATGLFLFLEFQMGGMGQALTTFAQHWPDKVEPPRGMRLAQAAGNLLIMGIGASMYPHAIQRIYAARSERTLKRSLAVMVFLPLVTTLPLFLVGVQAQALAGPDHLLRSDTAMPFVLNLMTESAVGSILVILVLTGAISAMMSTADSALLTVSSMVNRDFLERYVCPGKSPKFYLGVGKATSWIVVLGLAGVATWSVAEGLTIWRILSIKMELLMQVAPALWIGVRTKKLPPTAAFLGMVAGTVFTVSVWIWGGEKIGGLHAGVYALALNLAICFVGMAVRGRKAEA